MPMVLGPFSFSAYVWWTQGVTNKVARSIHLWITACANEAWELEHSSSAGEERMFWWLSLNSALASRLIHIDDPHISIQLFESKCEISHFNSYRHPNFQQFRMSIRNRLLSINYTELRKLKSLLQIQTFEKLSQNNKKTNCYALIYSRYTTYFILCGILLISEFP